MLNLMRGFPPHPNPPTEVLPLSEPVEVKAGNVIQVSFRYFAGGSLRSLERNMRAAVLDPE